MSLCNSQCPGSCLWIVVRWDLPRMKIWLEIGLNFCVISLTKIKKTISKLNFLLKISHLSRFENDTADREELGKSEKRDTDRENARQKERENKGKKDNERMEEISAIKWRDYLLATWPFTTRNICPMAKICFQSMFKIVPNTFFKFCKSG